MATNLIFEGFYRPPSGLLVELNFNPVPAGYAEATAEFTTELVAITAQSGVVYVASADLNLSNASISAQAVVACLASADFTLTEADIIGHTTALFQASADFTLTEVCITAEVSTFFKASADLFLSDASITAKAVVVNLASADFTLSDANVTANAVVVYVAITDFTLHDAGIVADSLFEAGVFRGIQTVKTGIDKHGQNFYRQLSGRFLHGHHQPLELASLFDKADLQYQDKCINWFEVAHKTLPTAVVWEPAQPIAQQRSTVYSASPRKYLDRKIVYGAAWVINAQRAGGYNVPGAKPRAWAFVYDAGMARIRAWLSGYGLGTDTNRVERSLWEQGTSHSWLWGGWHYPPYPPPPPYIPSYDLRYYQVEPEFIGGAILEFGRPCFAWPLTDIYTIILEGSTIVLHTIFVKRTADNIEVPVVSVSLKFDVDSWAWGVSLNLKTPAYMALLESVNGEPCEIQIEMNGVYLTALIEEYGETRAFGDRAYTATGRSTLALFAYPYAPLRTRLEVEDKTAAQLIDAELLNTGWEAVYHASLLQLFTTDWLVPGGAWSYQNKAPVDCIVQIARAVGARAYADRNAKLVHIDPRYPVNPWDWEDATLDKTIPVSLVRGMATQLSPQPEYNHVIVSGASHGVTVSAVIEGSGGDVSAPMITDNLITYVQAGRERARNILCNTGKQARVTLDLPLNSTTGLLEPGQLVEVTDTVPWRGLVTGITVAASHGVISQSVEIERHYESV